MPLRAGENVDGNGSYGSNVLLDGVAKESGGETCSTLSESSGMDGTNNLDNTTVLPDGGLGVGKLGNMQGRSSGYVVEEGEDKPTSCPLNLPRNACRTSLGRDDRVSARAELYDAVKLGQVEQVKSIVKLYEVDLSGVDNCGRTAVHIAAGHHLSHEVLKYLLESGASVGQRDKSGTLPLHVAVTGRNPVGVHHLLQFGAEVDARDHDLATPLFVASQAMFHEVIAELLAGGGNPALISGEHAQTPLHALIYAHTPASVQVAHRKRKVNRRSSMHPALLLSLSETVEAMVKAGAPLAIADKSGKTVLDATGECDHELLHRMLLLCDLARGDTILHAVRLGDASVVNKILDEGAVEARAVITDNGSSLLHLAAKGGNLELAMLLLTGQWLRRERALPLNIDARDSVGRTALFKASYFGHADVAQWLLESGASPAIQDMSGNGVGYTFAESVSDDVRASMCEVLQRWGGGSEERHRAESFVSAKAPEGDVIYLSGVVPLVDNSRTKHLWGPADKPPPPVSTPSGEGGVSEGPGGHRGRNSDQGDALAQHETVASPQQVMLAPTADPAIDAAGSTNSPWRDDRAIPGVESAAVQERIKGVRTEAGGEEELEVVHVCVRNRVKSSSTFGTDDDEREDRMISAISQQRAGSAVTFEEGPDAERNYRELSDGGKVRIRKADGKARRNRRHYKGSSSAAHAEGAADNSTPPGAPGNEVDKKTATKKSTQPDEGSAPDDPLSASPRSRNWKLRPCMLSTQLSVTLGEGSGGVGSADSLGTESAAAPTKLTPEPPKSKPIGRERKMFW